MAAVAGSGGVDGDPFEWGNGIDPVEEAEAEPGEEAEAEPVLFRGLAAIEAESVLFRCVAAGAVTVA